MAQATGSCSHKQNEVAWCEQLPKQERKGKFPQKHVYLYFTAILKILWKAFHVEEEHDWLSVVYTAISPKFFGMPGISITLFITVRWLLVWKKPPFPPSACNRNNLNTRKGKRLESAFHHIATWVVGTVQLSLAFEVKCHLFCTDLQK